jgi:transcription elongation GreA/GreB family factor
MSEQWNANTKEELLTACYNFINESISVINEALNDAQDAANSDSKGSAGDKHETGRAMMHLEKEKNAKQLAGRVKLLSVLALINPKEKHGKARLGSLIITNKSNYFLSIAMGKVEIDGELYFVISPVSPIGKLLLNTEKGSRFTFNAQEIVVEDVI